MLKKMVVFMACGLLVLSLFSCTTTPNTEEEKNGDIKTVNKGIEDKYKGNVPFKDLGGQVIKIAAWWDLTPPADATEETNDTIARKNYIEKKYNCKFEYVAVIESEMMNQIATSVAANAPVFDFGYVMNSNVPALVAKKYVEPLENITAIDINSLQYPKFNIQNGLINGKHYTLELLSSYYPRVVIYWNKTLFKKNGWEDLYELQRTKKWTWDKMLEIAKKATKDTTGDGVSDLFGLTGVSGLFQTAVGLSNNAELVSLDAAGKPTYKGDSANYIEAMQFLQDLINKYKVVDEPAKPSWDYYMNSFLEGKSAMNAGEMYMLSFLSEMEDDWGIVVPPMGPKATEYVSPCNLFGTVVMLANNPKKQEVGFAFDLYTALSEKTKNNPKEIYSTYKNYFRDEQSLETIEIINNGAAKQNNAVLFKNANELIGISQTEIIAGKKSPAVAMTSINIAVQKKLDDDFAAFSK